MTGIETAAAIKVAADLITLAIEASVAVNRISALIQARQAAGKEITQEDWTGLLSDRQIAQAMLLASIRNREVSGG